MTELISFIELARFLGNYPKRPVECFVGKYEHIYFNCTDFKNGEIDYSALISALDGVDLEERRVFVAQVIYCIIEGGDSLERLLRAVLSK